MLLVQTLVCFGHLHEMCKLFIHCTIYWNGRNTYKCPSYLEAHMATFTLSSCTYPLPVRCNLAPSRCVRIPVEPLSLKRSFITPFSSGKQLTSSVAYEAEMLKWWYDLCPGKKGFHIQMDWPSLVIKKCLGWCRNPNIKYILGNLLLKQLNCTYRKHTFNMAYKMLPQKQRLLLSDKACHLKPPSSKTRIQSVVVCCEVFEGGRCQLEADTNVMSTLMIKTCFQRLSRVPAVHFPEPSFSSCLDWRWHRMASAVL